MGGGWSRMTRQVKNRSQKFEICNSCISHDVPFSDSIFLCFVCDLDKFWLYFSNSNLNFRKLNQNTKTSSIEKLNISDSRKKKQSIIISNNLFDVQNLVLKILYIYYFEIFPDWLFAIAEV